MKNEVEMTECTECENGTQHLSNYVAQICDYCEGSGEVKTEEN